MKSKKWMLGFIVLLIGMFFLPEVHGLAEEGRVPKVLCSYPYNVFYGAGLDEVIKETACGLESDGEGNVYYVIEGQKMAADEDFVAGLMDAFGALPFADVAEMNAMLVEAGSLDFEMVDDARVVTTVEVLDEYMGEIRLKRLINETYAEYVGFYQDNINTDVLYLGDLGFLLNDTYELPKSTLTVHLLDPMTWYEVEWLERSLVFDLGDDFEMLKEMVFSNEFNEKYVDYLRMDLMTKDSLEQTRNNMLANGYYEDDVEYRLRNLGLGREVDGDWMKISLTNGIVLGLIFDEDMQQIEIWESFDHLDVPIATVGLVEGIEDEGAILESIGMLVDSDFDPFADFTELNELGRRILLRSDGRVIFSSIFSFPITHSSWDKTEEMQEEIFEEWLNGKPERERYFSYIDEINTTNSVLSIDSVTIDYRNVYYDLFEKNFNEYLFAVGDVVDVFTDERELSHLIEFSTTFEENPGYQNSYKFFALGDVFYEVKQYMLSDTYQAVLEEQFGTDYVYLDPDEYEVYSEYGNTNEKFMFLANGVKITITFSNSTRQIKVSEVVYGLDRNLDEYDTPPMTIERLGFDCDESNASVVMVNEPIELSMSFDDFYQLDYFWGSLTEGTAFGNFEVFKFDYDLDAKNLYFTIGGDVEKDVAPVSFVVYENWSYAPESGSGIGELNTAYEENFGVDAETGIPAFLTEFQNLFVTEFGISFEELVTLNLRQYTNFYAQY